jgi:hypothetical protein
VKTVALEVAGIAAVTTDILGRRETALSSRGVGGRSGTGSAQRGRRTGGSLRIAERLQVISCSVARLARAVERLALGLERRGSTGKGVMNTAERAATETWLAASLGGSHAAVVTQTRAKATIPVKRSLAESSRRRSLVIWCIGGDAIGLAVHTALSIWTKSALAVSRVILVIVRVAIVGVVVAGILLAV